MAWTCKSCNVDVPLDTDGCPSCGAFKASWTVVADKTRTFAIDRKKFELWRGRSAQPVRPDDPNAASALAELVPTDEVLAIPKSKAAALVEDGLRPAPRHVLVVRTFPRSEKEPTAVLTVLLSRAQAEEREFPTSRPDLVDGRFDLGIVFVFGEGEPPAFDGLHVVDVTDADAEPGHAPHVLVTGLAKKKPKKLPVRADAGLELHVIDPRGQPAAGERYRVEWPGAAPVEGALDGDGRALVPCAASEVRLVFPDRHWREVGPIDREQPVPWERPADDRLAAPAPEERILCSTDRPHEFQLRPRFIFSR